ncbi:hypothetical protein EDC37_10834 [Pectinatus cerevisiiphilus]|uniref:Uncharacterized protein n=2 Tax=Pectinatus cerevisiiphilus TaxID=86956 RepID=A0A4R3K7Z4_9FIRM|nr:hypothetical protein EDC37_10834 [Pectinatus cerevisiiphilus]
MAEELVHLIKGKIGVSYAAGMITFTVKIEC